MRTIVVDDNKLERNFICDLISNLDSEYEILASFSNGMDALEYVKNNEVDVVITDVQMPEMTGIELLDKINLLDKKIKVIIISNFDDFKYTKPAFLNNAVDYVLKPILEEDLAQALKKAKLTILEDEMITVNRNISNNIEQLKPTVTEQIVRYFLTHSSETISDKASQLEWLKNFSDIPVENTYISLIEGTLIKIIDSSMQIENDISFIMTSLKYTIEQMSDENKYLYCLPFPPKSIIVLCFRSNPEFDTTDFANELHEKLEADENVFMSFITSKSTRDFADIHTLYNQITYSREYLPPSKNNTSVVHFSEIITKNLPIINANDLIEQCKQIFESNDIEQVKSFLSKYITKGANNETYIKNFVNSCTYSIGIVLTEYNISLETIIGNNIWKKIAIMDFSNISEIENLMFNLFNTCITTLANEHKENKNLIVSRTKEYVNNHFNEKITMDSLAEAIHFSKKYVSRVFSASQNKTISDYITEVRVEKAKKILLETDTKVQYIPEMVGYKKRSHFANLFKEYTGLTFGQYREKYRK